MNSRRPTHDAPAQKAQLVVDRFCRITVVLVGQPDRAATIAENLGGFVAELPVTADHRTTRET